MFVYVMNQHGRPLMPCRPRRARLLLKQGKARVASCEPFTIQLLYGSSGYKQPIALGVDAGSKMIGVSATTDQHALFEAEVQLRTDIQELLATRAQFRRARRSRKTRYRKARCLNRKKPQGWLAPSVRHKLESHLKVIARVCALLPVTRIIIEVAQFDLQKLQFKLVRRNNRQLHKATIHKGGKRPRNTAPRYVYSFRLFDQVRYEGKLCFIFGRRSSGYFDLRTLDGTRVHASANVEKLRLVQRSSTCLVERRCGIPPSLETVGILPHLS